MIKQREPGHYWLLYGSMWQIGLYFGNDNWYLIGESKVYRSEEFADISSVKIVNKKQPK